MLYLYIFRAPVTGAVLLYTVYTGSPAGRAGIKMGMRQDSFRERSYSWTT